MKSRMLGGLLLLATIVLAGLLAGCETTATGDRSAGSGSAHGSASGSGSCH